MSQSYQPSFVRPRAVVVSALVMLAVSSAFAGTTHRPISDFIAGQGFVSFGPPGTQQIPGVPDFLGFTDTKRKLAVSADYAGLADKATGGHFGTTFSGDITESDGPNGRVKVHVVLQTSNALMWVIPFDFSDSGNQFGNNPLLFGARPADVAAGAAPALGSSTLTLDFLVDKAGQPMPDLLAIAFSGDLQSIRFVAQANGFFADGSGPGKVQVTQVGILDNGFHGAVADGFPAENILLIATKK